MPNRVVPMGLGQRNLSVSDINVTVQQELLQYPVGISAVKAEVEADQLERGVNAIE
jgi:hypothetical protein